MSIVNLLIWLVILGAVGLIFFILSKKLAVLANVDVDSIQAEKEAKIKERLINSKFQRQINQLSGQLGRFFLPLGKALKNGFYFVFNRLIKLREDYKTPAHLAGGDVEKKINLLFLEASDAEKQKDWNLAEHKYIEIIGLDSRNIKAFEALGEIYHSRQDFSEAKQTLEHTLKLKEKLANNQVEELAKLQAGLTCFTLGVVHQSLKDYGEALAYFKKALHYEPNNPRYLDRTIELCIIKEDKSEALDAYKKLQETNPENQKLKDFKERIKEL